MNFFWTCNMFNLIPEFMCVYFSSFLMLFFPPILLNIETCMYFFPKKYPAWHFISTGRTPFPLNNSHKVELKIQNFISMCILLSTLSFPFITFNSSSTLYWVISWFFMIQNFYYSIILEQIDPDNQISLCWIFNL